MARTKYTVTFPAAKAGDEVTWQNAVNVYPDANAVQPLINGYVETVAGSFTGWSDATSVTFTRAGTDAVTVTAASPTGTGAAVPSAASSITYPAGASATVVDRPTGSVAVTDYGAKADGKTYWSGATTNASATLTDTTTAPFVAGDVGKVIVVNNGVSNGTHLYTTIATFVDASHVTLTVAPTNTIATALYSYGTDDSTAWTNAVAACPAGGTLAVPATPSLVTTRVVITKSMSIVGASLVQSWGKLSTNGSKIMPTVAPFLNGSVLIQAGANQDGFYTTVTGATINFRNVGVYFAGLWKTTGHGFWMSSAATSLGLGLDNGLDGSTWENCVSFGHDLTHWAMRITNPLNNAFMSCYSYGGGGFWFENNSDQNPYGNSTCINFFWVQMGGSLVGYNGVATLGTGMTNMAFIRPQTVTGGYAGTLWANWNLTAAGANGVDFSTSSQVIVVSPDFEAGNILIGSNNIELSAGGTPYPYTVTGKSDAAPFMRQVTSRRINMDGSVSLDTAEAAGSSLWVLNDNVTGRRWGPTTDGTAQFLAPGRFALRGDGVIAAAAAGLGTGPPLMRAGGTDTAGTVYFGSGTVTAAGALVTLTFGLAYPYTPRVEVVPGNAATAALGPFYATATTTGVTIGSQNAPTASQAIGTYVLHYKIDLAGPAGAMTAYDQFTRADTSVALGTADSGAAWTVLGGTIGIVSNQASWVANGASNAMSYITTASGDFQIDADFPAYAGGGGLLLRATAANKYIYTNSSSLSMNNTGSFSSLSNFTTGFGAGDHITVIAEGATIVVRRNGKLVGSTNVATVNQTTANAGLRGDTTGMKWDNFVVG